jgi:hypothetical protein
MPPWCSAARLLGRQQGDGRMADDGGGPLRAVEVQQDAAQALVVLQVLQRCMACILNLQSAILSKWRHSRCSCTGWHDLARNLSSEGAAVPNCNFSLLPGLLQVVHVMEMVRGATHERDSARCVQQRANTRAN